MENPELVLVSLVLILLGLSSCSAGPTLMSPSATIATITRQNNGDIFHADVASECNPDTCIGVSSGTAGTSEEIGPDGTCPCQCHTHQPAFREDLQICVDDIHECVLAPFVSGSISQQIPFVFLPLKGQIIHPSKEISFSGIAKPVCAVSGAKFLTEGGWVDLRSPLDADVPFRLFRDEGRTFLQWVGETELRNRMGGRLVLVHLMCREISTKDQSQSDPPTVFTPCVAFRVVGTPIKYLSNVSEVLFSTDSHHSGDGGNSATATGLTVTEYVAIGVSSVLLGLIYVASVFLYLHLRKQRRRDPSVGGGGTQRRDKDNSAAVSVTSTSGGGGEDGIGGGVGGGGSGNNHHLLLHHQNLSGAEEGVVKSNPLLGLVGRHFGSVGGLGLGLGLAGVTENSYSDTGSSDTDAPPDILQHHDDRKKNIQITSALIHPQYNSAPITSYHHLSSLHQDPSSIECLPEENVSIVETLEGREDRPDTVKSISGTTRRKLYFNPAYFEPQLLMSPPPAAVEFLTKIREVISIAKLKMATKRFTPSLLGIPEEDPRHLPGDHQSEYSRTAVGSRRSSMISLKRENSRRRTCSGCPGCEPQDFKALSGKLPQFPALGACENCATSTNNESKQRSIRKWLEDVPIIKTPPTSGDEVSSKDKMIRALQTTTPMKRIRSPARSLSPDQISEQYRALSPRPSSERAMSPNVLESGYEQKASSIKSNNSRHSSTRSKPRKNVIKPKAPPPPLPPNPPRIVASNFKRAQEQLYDTIAEPGIGKNLPPPDMIHEAMVVDSKVEEPKMPTITKRNMNAVLNEFAVQHGLEQHKPEVKESSSSKRTVDYDADSLERNKESKGYSTPTDYADLSSSQPSPSLSAALPMDEEMTMRNAIINTKTGNMTISKLNMEQVLKGEEDDYELIILKKSDNGSHCIYKLPELLQRNHGYSLVSEVYVNNGYNYGSAPSTPNDSNCSTLERTPKIIYEDNKPGHLLIEVEDCPDNYIRVDDSDSFEPDTLDRKPSKMKIFKALTTDFDDSLERPNQILLRTNGTFKSESLSSLVTSELQQQFNRNFGSLREIYEAKLKGMKGDQENEQPDEDTLSEMEFEGRILTLEERHSKRQRKSPNPNKKSIPPDVIPPTNRESAPIYEHPKPPRKVIIDAELLLKPPLPPKSQPTSQSPPKKIPPAVPKKKLSTPPVEHSNSDYETCTVINGESPRPATKECKNSDLSILKNFIHSDDVLFKNGINNQLILQASSVVPRQYPKLDRLDFLDKRKKLTHVPGGNKSWRRITTKAPDDSGYLSTDSNESHVKKSTLLPKDKTRAVAVVSAGSETDESLGDGQSESGAESVETHSVFFGSYKKSSSYVAGSIDSGVGSDLKPTEAVNMLGGSAGNSGGGVVNSMVIDEAAASGGSDSETMSYTTVVPLGSVRSRTSTRSSLIRK